ncbi:MAG: mechanosensitive ion channel family protein [Sedimenticola sp.]|uniref:Small-conductance mechanosensitive channel n=1 Tax=Sedimenticola thiotaurini TaxID=1543721 RepID=A0A558DFZ2_9GAMM|nr:mechanosensitive ion channel family protein [Sedimenticola sp.]TVT59783.1 MAG: mechanosensitive ion channel family protein [Sedimenticola thiotaurini]
MESILEQLKPVIGLFGQSPYMKAAVVLLLSLLAAKLVGLFVNRGIRKLTGHTKTSLDDELITLLHRPLFWTVVLLGMLLAATVAELSPTLLVATRAAIISLLLFWWMLFGLRASRVILSSFSRHGDETSLVRPQTLPLFTNLVAIIIIALGVYFIFQAWSVDMTAWLASAGIAGIAIGFAAKDTLANLFSGVFILADSPYKIGDYVVIDNTVRGMVTHIGIRSTRLLTRDDVEVTIPNSVMGNSKVVNESGGPHEKYRIRIRVSVAYGSDIDQVCALMQTIGEEEPQVCSDPVPRVRFRSFGDSGLVIDLMAWVEKPELRGKVSHALNCTIYKRFMAEGIEIPYMKQDLYIKSLPDTPWQESSH